MIRIMSRRAVWSIFAIGLIVSQSVGVSAKSLKVESFIPAPFDMSASMNQKPDNNGVPGAMIKLSGLDNLGNVSFEGNVIAMKNDGSEIQAYFTAGTKSIVVKSPGFSPLRIVFSDFGVYRLTSKSVYNLLLQTADSSGSSSTQTAASIHDLLDNSDGDPIDEMVAKANRLYSEGRTAQAIPLLEKAAKLGHTEAQLSLGLLYENGVGSPDKWILIPDESKAFELVRNSAYQGYAPAQKVLSRYYLTGIGTEVNKERGDGWKTI